ncbi:MAG: KH domain-containing protein [Candidatus Atribacteria bacterium]|nr:KH domain-containing protein [Candidatus Atribacteria bacterium]
MKEVIEYLLKSIVDFPEQLKVNEVNGEQIILLEVRSDPRDMGKIIGKEGKVIKAIRVIAKAATIKQKKKTIIKIIE